MKKVILCISLILSSHIANAQIAGVLTGNSINNPIGTSAFSDNNNVKGFGAVCDGNSHPLSGTYGTLAAAQAVYPAATALTDELDESAIVKALNSLGTTGGSVLIDSTSKCYINKALILPVATELRGTLRYRGSPGAANQPQIWGSLGSTITEAVTLGNASFSGSVMTASAPSQGQYSVGQAIFVPGQQLQTVITSFGTGTGGAGTYNINNNLTLASTAINATASIVLQSGSGVKGLLVQRAGITYTEANANAFEGVGITNMGEPYDTYVSDSAIMGFNIGIESPSGARVKIESDNIDSNACLDLAYSYDTTRVLHVHCWPFVTYSNSSGTSSRSGIAFYIHGHTDGSIVDDVLSFDHQGGGLVYGSTSGNSFASNIFIDGSAPDRVDTQYGLWFQPGSGNIQVTNADIYTQGYGVYNDTTNGDVGLSDIRVHYSKNSNYLIASGNIRGSNWLSDSPLNGDGINISNATSHVTVTGYKALGTPQGVSQYDVLSQANNTSTSITNYDTDIPSSATPSMNISGSYFPSIASAATLALPQSGDTFIITGTTTIGSVPSFYPGRRVTFIIQNGLTIVNQGNNFFLNGSTNAVLTAGSTITFVTTASGFYEVSRMVR